MWECSNCSEQIDDDLDVCWNCQTAKDGSSPEDYFTPKQVSRELADLQERMSAQTDSDLLRIINVDFKDYREEAIDLARAELERRGVPQPPRPKPNKKIERHVSSPVIETTEIAAASSDLCSNCVASLDDDAKFCPSCAAPVSPRCPSCGKTVSADARFCKYCASELTQKVSTVRVEKFVAASTTRPLPPKQQFSSGVDALLADKYHALSDSQLLAMLRGDLSGQTEKSLSIALAELETRTNIDWRDMSMAKTRIREAIVAAHSDGSVANTARYNVSRDLAGEKAGRLAKAGGITAVISALLFLWGYSYTSNFANSARAGLMNLAGQPDSTYTLAQVCITFGAIGFIIGVVLLIVGLAQR